MRTVFASGWGLAVGGWVRRSPCPHAPSASQVGLTVPGRPQVRLADQQGRWSLPGANGVRERVIGWRFGRETPGAPKYPRVLASSGPCFLRSTCPHALVPSGPRFLRSSPYLPWGWHLSVLRSSCPRVLLFPPLAHVSPCPHAPSASQVGLTVPGRPPDRRGDQQGCWSLPGCTACRPEFRLLRAQKRPPAGGLRSQNPLTVSLRSARSGTCPCREN